MLSLDKTASSQAHVVVKFAAQTLIILIAPFIQSGEHLFHPSDEFLHFIDGAPQRGGLWRVFDVGCHVQSRRLNPEGILKVLKLHSGVNRCDRHGQSPCVGQRLRSFFNILEGTAIPDSAAPAYPHRVPRMAWGGAPFDEGLRAACCFSIRIARAPEREGSS